MPWQLVPLHTVEEETVLLPDGGDATVGRRPHNTVVCRDLAVSGTHCILHCCGTEPPEFEDCSTNGSFVNDVKLLKGQRRKLVVGDVLSLTKPLETLEVTDGNEPGPRIQYRLDFKEASAEDDGGDLPPTMPEPRRPPSFAQPPAKETASRAAAAKASEHCFAQDLLVQEQQSKAKVTADLLVSQRKLEEERQAVESMTRELRKVRQQVEEERTKRQEAEEGRDRLTGEVEALRSESRQLLELTATHEGLRDKHEAAAQDLRGRVQRCEELEALQVQLRRDLAAASEAQQKASQQHAELQIRARQAQERAERLQQQHADAQREAEKAQEDGQRIKQDLEADVASRTQLEEQVAASKQQVSKAEAAERAAREELDAATSRRAGLECQAAAAQSEADSARVAARQVKHRLSASRGLSDRLKESGKGLSTELRRRLELWDKVLLQGLPSGLPSLEEAVSGSDVAPTFAQATCRVEDAPTKSQHVDTQAEAGLPEAASRKNVDQLPSATVNQQEEPAGAAAQATVVAVDADQSALLASGGAEEGLAAPAAGGSARSEAAAVQPAVVPPASGDQVAGAVVTSPTASGGTGGLAAAGGCSTAWSLEVLDLVEPAPPPKKKTKRGA